MNKIAGFTLVQRGWGEREGSRIRSEVRGQGELKVYVMIRRTWVRVLPRTIHAALREALSVPQLPHP